MTTKVLRDPQGLCWFGLGEGKLSAPPPEFLKKQNEFTVWMNHGAETHPDVGFYNHFDLKDDTWVAPLDRLIIAWFPRRSSMDGADMALQRFLINTIPSTGELLDLVSMDLLPNGCLKIEVRGPLGSSIFLG